MKAEQERLPRFAVLIDADNTSPQIVGGLFEEVAKFGEASVRRIYGDFSGPQLRSWFDILQKHAIDPYQQFAYTKGKNASDIALVIDAMDLESFRQACRRFIYTENLLPQAVTSGADTPSKSKSLQPPSAAIPILEKAISQIESEDGWVMLGPVGQHISNLFSDFDVRSYGHSKLSDLARKTGAFDVEKIEGGHMRIRAKPANGSAKTKTR